jgi:hypothetical protein
LLCRFRGGLSRTAERFGQLALGSASEIGGCFGHLLLARRGFERRVRPSLRQFLGGGTGGLLSRCGVGHLPGHLGRFGCRRASRGPLLLGLSAGHRVQGLLQSLEVRRGILRLVGQRLFDRLLDLGDLVQLAVGDGDQLVGRLCHVVAQRGGGLLQLAGRLLRGAGGLGGLRLGRFTRRLPGAVQLLGRTSDGLTGLLQLPGDVRRCRADSFGDLLGDGFHLGLFIAKFRRPLGGQALLGRCGLRFAGQFPFAGGRSFQGFRGTSQFTDLDRKLTALGVGQLRFGFGQRAANRLLGAGSRLLPVRGSFRRVVLHRLDGFGHRLFCIGQPRFDRAGQFVALPSRLGGLVQSVGNRLLLRPSLAHCFGRFVRHLLLLLGELFEALLQLFELLDLPGQFFGGAVRLVLLQGLLEHLFEFRQAADHPALFGHRLLTVGFEQLSCRFVSGRFGLFQQRLGGRHFVQRLIQLAERLVNLCLLLDQRLDALLVQRIALADLFADLLLFVEQFTDQLQGGLAIRTDEPLSFFDLFQQRPQSAQHDPLALSGFVVPRRFQRLARPVQLDARLRRFQNAQPVGGARADLSAPLADVGQRFDQHQKQRFHVALVLDVRQHGRFTLFFRPFVQRAGHAEGLAFERDHLADLSGQFGNLQAAEQFLTFGHQPDDHVADLAARRFKSLKPFLAGALLSLDQQLDHRLHLGVHQRVDVLAHGDDLLVDRQVHQSVLAQLPDLDLQHPGDQFAGQLARPLLRLLLGPQIVRVHASGNLRTEQRSNDAQHPQKTNRSRSRHGDVSKVNR